MKTFVVDTNVPKVANGNSEQADPDCVISCINKLIDLVQGGIVILDDAMRILNEYMHNLSMSGQPGAGDMFMKWVWQIQADESRCNRVPLTQRSDNPDDFLEFPDDPDLAKFDWRDRKFVASALASGTNPEILNAVDDDWAQHNGALIRNGVNVIFLCPQCVMPDL